MTDILQRIQKSRIGAALKSLLRVALGRDIPRAEIDSRVASYINPTIRGSLGGITPQVGPLFIASDYTPLSVNDPLGGPDGRDISRGWSAVREDLDCGNEAMSEASRRLSSSLQLLRQTSNTLSLNLQNLTTSAQALEQQAQQSFYGGAASSVANGQASTVFNNTANQNTCSPQTTGILLDGGVGTLPTLGQAIDGSSGAQVDIVTLINSSDTTLLSDQTASAWLTNPFAQDVASWSYIAGDWVTIVMPDNTVSALELNMSQGALLSSITQGISPVAFSSVQGGGTSWIVFNSALPANTQVTLTFGGSGSVYSLQAHTFAFNSQGQFVWGPFATLSSSSTPQNALFTVTLQNIVQAVPANSSVVYGISTVGPDGPWTTITSANTPIVLSASNREELDLYASDALPDPTTLGYTYFPVSNVGSPYGAVFSAGTYQSKVDAFPYNWTSQNDPVHLPTVNDWATPNGVVRTVAMGSGPNYQGNLGTQQTAAIGSYLTAGTCLGNYIDNNGQSLMYIGLTSNNPSQPILTPGYNYRFTFALFVSAYAQLTSVPIGCFNPGGTTPGAVGAGFTVILNGSQIYQSSSYFTNYNEISPQPPGYAEEISSYLTQTPTVTSQGLSSLSNPPGAVWPPYCGRMNMTLSPGWNTLQILVYMPDLPTGIPATLANCASIVMGPNLFTDPGTLYQNTGIQIVRGWSENWTQESEFDLRRNVALGQQEVWAWETDPTTFNITGVLLNHNPAASETGFLSLDNQLTGNARNHHLSYLLTPQGLSSPSPGQDPFSPSVYVNAQLQSSNPTSGPFLSSFGLVIN